MAETSSAEIRIVPGGEASASDRAELIANLTSREAVRPDLQTYELGAERIAQEGCLLAYVDGSPCGLLVTTPIERGANSGGLWLDVMAVLPDARRLGVARALMLALRDWAGSHGCNGVELHVDDDNRKAIGLFEAMGFHTQSRFMRLEVSNAGR
jgi:GNAT superfamily N-acetyltransferase